MTRDQDKDAKSPPTSAQGAEDLMTMGVLAVVVGAVTGILTAMFRLALERADLLRNLLLAWAHGLGPAGMVPIVTAAAAAVAVSAWLVRRFAPSAKGSGIPHVEAVMRGETTPAPPHVILVKFVGGVLAIGAGLALGREGPSVQMGAVLGRVVGTIFFTEDRARHTLALLAAGAGAGLATAFNAPVAGAVFILEEVVRRYDVRHTITTLGASACAIAVSRLFLGGAPDFQVAPLPYAGSQSLPLYFLLGVAAGLLGAAYNRAILGTLAFKDRFRRWPAEVRAAVIGGAVGAAAWFLPNLVGGGEAIAQRVLAGGETLLALSPALLFRFWLGPVSYAADTPGGLFAPILVIGAQGGLIFGTLCSWWVPSLAPLPMAFAVVGMAAFFTACVRAPVTGIVLITEMTASFTLLLPLLTACFAAMIVPTLMGSVPIYDSLREPAAQDKRG